MDDDILVEVKKEDYPLLLEKCDNDYGKHMYCYMLNYITWFKKTNEVKVQFYCPSRRIQDTDTIIVICEEGMYQVTVFTYDKTCEELKKCLKETNRIDWTRGPLFNNTLDDHYKPIEEELARRNLKIAAKTYSAIYRFRSTDPHIFKYSIPDDVEIIPLTLDHAKIINDEWVYKMEGSEEFIKKLITFNGGIALVGKKEKDLRSWVLIWGSGGPGVLHTMKQHNGKGYGKMVSAILTKMITDRNLDAFAFVSQTNKPSRAVFEKIGYTYVAVCHWMLVENLSSDVNNSLSWI